MAHYGFSNSEIETIKLSFIYGHVLHFAKMFNPCFFNEAGCGSQRLGELSYKDGSQLVEWRLGAQALGHQASPLQVRGQATDDVLGCQGAYPGFVSEEIDNTIATSLLFATCRTQPCC